MTYYELFRVVIRVPLLVVEGVSESNFKSLSYSKNFLDNNAAVKTLPQERPFV